MTAKGTSLPERLRSRAKVEHYQYKDMLTAAVMREAADELDRRAEEIQRLGYKLRRIGELAGPPGAWPHTPDLDERPKRKPAQWDQCYCDRAYHPECPEHADLA